ncbi:hypothetical protein K435DRAFT_867918 [Dendrothele bispora CBS 962.96]|uniref:Uncharacterized protein n=1 Tax=Dendrothele bispora (strain CBS 962.96) TaxID=1314807 RepID=A0A4S8LD34_DENBC|nr:hypothetical protein K435DRAFT_867918 [Dendrothele bispora CBS 962.96]
MNKPIKAIRGRRLPLGNDPINDEGMWVAAEMSSFLRFERKSKLSVPSTTTPIKVVSPSKSDQSRGLEPDMTNQLVVCLSLDSFGRQADGSSSSCSSASVHSDSPASSSSAEITSLSSFYVVFSNIEPAATLPPLPLLSIPEDSLVLRYFSVYPR